LFTIIKSLLLTLIWASAVEESETNANIRTVIEMTVYRRQR
jgi:hypothetical protein